MRIGHPMGKIYAVQRKTVVLRGHLANVAKGGKAGDIGISSNERDKVWSDQSVRGKKLGNRNSPHRERQFEGGLLQNSSYIHGS